MGKTLLQSLEPTEANETVNTVKEKPLNELLLEMKPQLDNASNDLLKPREEVVNKLMKQLLS